MYVNGEESKKPHRLVRLFYQSVIFCCIETEIVLMNAGQVAMALDHSIGVFGLEAPEQSEQGVFLFLRAGVAMFAFGIDTALVAYTQRVLVVAYGMDADELFVTCLVDGAVAGDVVVIARESEFFRVIADELCHGKGFVAACGAAVNHNQVDFSHTS